MTSQPKYKKGDKVLFLGHHLIVDHWNDDLKEYVCYKEAKPGEKWFCQVKHVERDGE